MGVVMVVAVREEAWMEEEEEAKAEGREDRVGS